MAFCRTPGHNSTLGLPLPSVVGWLADRPIFHLVLNWARNLYPYFADTEGAEGGRHRRHLGSKRASERRRDACRKFWQRQRNCNCANHAPPSVRPPVRPSVADRPSRYPFPPFPPSLSPFPIHPLPIAKSTAACTNSAGLSDVDRDTYLMPA